MTKQRPSRKPAKQHISFDIDVAIVEAVDGECGKVAPRASRSAMLALLVREALDARRSARG